MKHYLGIIGFGGMGGWHRRYAMQSDVVELAGIYDIDPIRCDAAREAGIHAYGSLEELLSDERIDIVTIATPNEVHKEIAIKAMQAGKNVISEKPVTLCTEDLQEMIDASKKYGKVFSVHQNRRWDVDFLMTKKLYDSKEIGRLFTIESRIHGSRGIPGDWRGKKEHGGGMLYDWGIHLIDQALQVVSDSKVSEIFCRFDHLTNKEVDDGFRMDITFENGVRYLVEVGTYNFVSMPRFYILGEMGSAIIRDWQDKCEVVRCKEWYQSNVTPVVTAAGLTKTMAPRDELTTETYYNERPASDVHDYYRNFCKAVEGTEEQIVKHTEMMRVLKVIEAGFESVERNAPVKVDI
ncbi:MAG: Gfo/Idh/MocA family oxidoreductase [Clostridia bacterium]|nr:Gfo/Idh/MocA family oxidoreductase [Clostridia bacterium]